MHFFSFACSSTSFMISFLLSLFVCLQHKILDQFWNLILSRIAQLKLKSTVYTYVFIYYIFVKRRTTNCYHTYRLLATWTITTVPRTSWRRWWFISIPRWWWMGVSRWDTASATLIVRHVFKRLILLKQLLFVKNQFMRITFKWLQHRTGKEKKMANT